MYAIVDVIVGIPINQDVMDALEALGMEPEDAGFETMYSGSAEITPGYCGVKLDGFDEASDSIDVSTLNLTPTKTQLAKATALVGALPAGVQDVAPKLAVYLVWSTS
jgi:hypothetical protein